MLLRTAEPVAAPFSRMPEPQLLRTELDVTSVPGASPTTIPLVSDPVM